MSSKEVRYTLKPGITVLTGPEFEPLRRAMLADRDGPVPAAVTLPEAELVELARRIEAGDDDGPPGLVEWVG